MKRGQDFVSLHHYYSDTDTMRFSHAPAGVVRLCDIGQPVLVEEFGVSTALWSESAQADYFRVPLFFTWAAGAAGALSWCWSDFLTADLLPYTYHPSELFFGITHIDGSKKPAAEEMRLFARLMGEVDATRWSPAQPQAAILVPSAFYDVNYPFRKADRPRLLKALLEVYTLARMAGFDVVFVRELGFPPKGVRLLLVPFADLLSPTWHELQGWEGVGGVLWAGGGLSSAPVPWKCCLPRGVEVHRWSEVHRLYRALRKEAGISPPFDSAQPALSLGVLEGEDGVQLLVAINHGDAQLKEGIRCRQPPRCVLDLESGEELEVRERRFRLPMEPWGVRVLEIGG